MAVELPGRLILGHAVVTLIDLSERGFLSTEEIGPGPSCDWRIEVTTGQGPSGLLPFEQAMLGHLVRDTGESLLSELTERIPPALQQFQKDLVRELACGTSGLQVARAPSIAICPMR
jgi:hypothetical protein